MTAAPRPPARSRRPPVPTQTARRPSPRRFDAASAHSGGKLAPFPQRGELAPLPPRPVRKSPPVELIASPRSGATLQPASLNPPPRLQRTARRLARSAQQQGDRPVVQSIPVARKPRWLNQLLRTQRASTVITTGLVTLSFAMYGWTVYIQHLWRGEFDRMQALERQERQLTAASETLRQHLANQAERPDSGLILPTPESAIFLPAPSPAPAQSAVQSPVQSPASEPAAPLPAEVPMAY
ncbi:MAG TPA: hypothetical protein IGS51_19315 [Thermoleptolyngbya sp. M55_K2018_002]|nr:hypothetical protein [Thermoleptolyngbya sp. M55_K2018_002]